jgi:hypothetical protein
MPASISIKAHMKLIELDSPPPSGSKGFMLGDIFGCKAGLTCAEVMLFLFFDILPDALLFLESGLFDGDPTGSCGDLIPSAVLIETDKDRLSGRKDGVPFLLPPIFGVVDPLDCCSVGPSTGVVDGEAARLLGRLFEICVTVSDEGDFPTSLIKDAGVAGASPSLGNTNGERFVGTGGGAIKDSDKGSGEIDSASELSSAAWLCAFSIGLSVLLPVD